MFSAQTAGPYLDWLARAGYRRFRIELVDEPVAVVAGLVTHYARALDAASAAAGPPGAGVGAGATARAGVAAQLEYQTAVGDLVAFLGTVPDANGRCHGATEGSLRPAEERHWDTLRPTAAEVRA